MGNNVLISTTLMKYRACEIMSNAKVQSSNEIQSPNKIKLAKRSNALTLNNFEIHLTFGL
jgi:hypothetical protein